MKSLSLSNCVLEIVVMIVLGWMFFVGLACYMGTFPKFTVSNDPACKSVVVSQSWLWLTLPTGVSDQVRKIVEVSLLIGCQDAMGTKFPRLFPIPLGHL